jgi:hypothetical protein
VARFEGSKLSIGVRKSANFCAAAASIRYCKTVEGVRFGRSGAGKRLEAVTQAPLQTFSFRNCKPNPRPN